MEAHTYEKLIYFCTILFPFLVTLFEACCLFFFFFWLVGIDPLTEGKTLVGLIQFTIHS